MDNSLTLPCDAERLAQVIAGICFAFDRDLDVHVLLGEWAGRERELLIRLWNSYVLTEKPVDVNSDSIASSCETSIDLKRAFDCCATQNILKFFRLHGDIALAMEALRSDGDALLAFDRETIMCVIQAIVTSGIQRDLPSEVSVSNSAIDAVVSSLSLSIAACQDSKKGDLSISLLPKEVFFQDPLKADLSISCMRDAVVDFADELDISPHEDTVEAVLGVVLAECTVFDSTSTEIDTPIDAIVSDAMHKFYKLVCDTPPTAQKNPSSSSIEWGDKHMRARRSSSFSIFDEETDDADGLLNRIDLEEAYDLDWSGSSLA